MAPTTTSSSSSLTGCTIAFAGSHSACEALKGQKIGDIKTSIAESGGAYSTKIGQDCTHLVISAKQLNANGVKVQEAAKHSNIQFVDFGWLAQSLESDGRVDETLFLYGSAAVPQNGTRTDADSSAPVTDKKRRRGGASDVEDIVSDSSHLAKKQKDGTSIIVSGSGNKSRKQDSTKDGQKAKSASISVPVDDKCPLFGSHKVHIDGDGTIFDVTLNQTNAGSNNNKFYRIQILSDSDGDYRTWTRWGRVGEVGQNKLLGAGSFANALSEFEKKFKDKTGNTWQNRLEPAKSKKYTFVEKNYEDSSNEDDDELPGAGNRRASKESIGNQSIASIESKLPGPVQRLVKLIFNQEYMNETLASLDYDATKMPLGKLSKRTLKAGYQVLKDIAALIGDQSLALSQYSRSFSAVTEDLSNSYFSTIPHDFGRKRPPVLRDIHIIKKEIDLLENLTDMQLANEIMKTARGNKGEGADELNVIDRQYQGLNMAEMTPLDMNSAEFGHIQDYLKKSTGQTHSLNYQVHDIFRIEREGEGDRFHSSPYAKVKNSDRRLLWHGSRCTNFGGILSQGLRIAPPEAPVSGYMFGKGIYLADISTKSAGYCASFSSGNIGLLLLCEAELGKPPLKLNNADHNAGDRAKEKQCFSTLGVGQTAPKGWKDASCVHESLKGVVMPDTAVPPGPSGEAGACLLYNEYIVYDVAQIRLRYLLRVEIGHGFID